MKARHVLLPILALVLAAAPATAQSYPNSRGHWGTENALRFHLGGFEPRGDSTYWTDQQLDFTGNIDDFDDVSGGVDYVRFLSLRMALVASGTVFKGETDQAYLDFVDERQRDIFHTTEIEIATFNLGLMLNLARRDRAVIPYVGVGGGLYAWRLTEFGDFIDFGLVDLEIFTASFEDDGATLGWYGQIGLEVPLAPNLSIFADARWTRAEDDLEGEFDGLGDIDLSGRTLSAGVTWSF